MSEIDDLVADVAAGPQGPTVGAFFDFDGTLIAGYSALAFLRNRVRHGELPFKEIVEAIHQSIDFERHGRDVSHLVRLGVEAEAGRPADEFERWSRKVFAREIAQMLYPDARPLVRAHLDAGHHVVVVSSATMAQVRPTADDLGIDDIVCTEAEVDDEGVLTGRLARDVCWGDARAVEIDAFATRHGIDLTRSYAYADGAEDVPMLKLVGHPVALNPDHDLARIAREAAWSTGSLTEPPKAGPVDAVRTIAGLSAFGGGVLTGAIFGLLSGSRRSAANVAGEVGPGAGLRAAGVRLSVLGKENLTSALPAVFTFNHQSPLDVLVLAALLRKDFTAVAKKELSEDPFFAPLGYMIDIVYIDRTNHAKALDALKPVIDTLHGGRSLAIAPEGTRSPTAKLGPFKKGAFNIAMQAGVPIVPIVMRNCGELMPSHAMVIRPGTIDVAVLAPIDTTGWTHDTLDQHVTEVRQAYLDTLAHWPQPEGR